MTAQSSMDRLPREGLLDSQGHVGRQSLAQVAKNTPGEQRARIIGDWLKAEARFLDKEQLMAEPEVEAAWRAEFKRFHDTEAFHSVPDARKAAFRWSGDEAEARRLQEEHAHHYLRWTFVGAFAAMIVGVIGLGLSFLH